MTATLPLWLLYSPAQATSRPSPQIGAIATTVSSTRCIPQGVKGRRNLPEWISPGRTLPIRLFLIAFSGVIEKEVFPCPLRTIQSLLGSENWGLGTENCAGPNDLPPFFAHGIIRHFLHSGLRLRTAEPVKRSRPQPPSSL